jgi:peptidoglycan-N-acetylglucosamine deacetylase
LDFGQNILLTNPDLLKRTEPEIQLFFCDFGGKFIAKELKQYLLDKTESIHEDIRSLAFESVLSLYPKEFMEERFLHSKDNLINMYLIKSITKINAADDWKRIVPFLFREGTREEAIYGLSTIARQTPRVLQLLIDLFHKELDNERKKIYAHILSSRIEVLFMKLLAKDKERIRKLLHEIISIGKVSDVIGFLNKNTNREIENEIVAILRGIIETDTVVERELRIYLNERILAKLSLKVLVEEKKRHDSKKEKNKIIILYCILVLSILVLPIVYMIRRSDILSEWTFLEHFKQFVIDFNYYLVFYFVAVNAINILILLFSVKGMNSQSRYWKMKKATFLFRKYILPSVSIIAPAYGEEATIIESTNSLLNLNYPDYEIIVVNDGSSDTTLNTLIDYFNLEKVDIHINFSLATKPVRGIYINKAFPKLVVVDKANGGKADSLNAGINISRKDFFCGIDADSLLEPDALLKVASMTLNSDKETVAAGGNIFPIDGCSVDKGHISNIRIPKNTIARFQTMEYIRAFMAGRVGWAFINCLLIISGAFGLFNKKRIIEIGGYLTSSGKFGKDTVGEDMELVVRLARHMKEKKIPAKIQYAFNANCWTEVPESFNILYKQRDRWHRGLIDILTFHKKLLFNPKYENIGMIALPYFFMFEMIGPLFEIMGYLMVIVAIILGMINTTLALLLFSATILMGIFVSLCSLLIAEKEVNYFSRKDFFILLFFSFIENIGFRQAMSFIRVIGYINSLKKPKGWGKMVRKGFSNKG